MNETSLNIGVGQGVNIAGEFLKEKEFNKEEFKNLAREISDVVFELRAEFTDKFNNQEVSGNEEPA